MNTTNTEPLKRHGDALAEPFIHPGSFDPIAPTDKDSLTVDPYAELKAAAFRGARIRYVDTKGSQLWSGWRAGCDWAWIFPPDHYEIHPDDQDKPAPETITDGACLATPSGKFDVYPEPAPFDLAAHVIANGFRPLALGEQWHRQDWTAEMLPMGTRPALLGEQEESKEYMKGAPGKPLGWVDATWPGPGGVTAEIFHHRTTRPLPDLAPAAQADEGSLGQLAYQTFHKNSIYKDIHWHKSPNTERWESTAQAVAAAVRKEMQARLEGERGSWLAMQDAHESTIKDLRNKLATISEAVKEVAP